MNFSARRKRARAAAQSLKGSAKVGALVVTHPPDVRYLTGFTGSNGAVVLADGRAVLFTDGRYTAQAKAEVRGVRVVIEKRSAVAAACAWLEAAGVNRCGFDGTQTTVAGLEGMRKAVSGKVRRGMFVDAGPVVAGLREVKDEDEIAVMRRAAALGCELFCNSRDGGMLGFMQAGLSEMEVAAELEHRARLVGRRR